MAYTLLDPQPSNLTGTEVALDLGGGVFVAVSVTPTWLSNGAGVGFTGSARVIDAEGVAQTCPNGQAIESYIGHTADAPTVQALGVPTISKECLLALLGEPLTPDTVHWSDEFLLNTSIRHAVTSAAATAPSSAASLLGLL